MRKRLTALVTIETHIMESNREGNSGLIHRNHRLVANRHNYQVIFLSISRDEKKNESQTK